MSKTLPNAGTWSGKFPPCPTRALLFHTDISLDWTVVNLAKWLIAKTPRSCIFLQSTSATRPQILLPCPGVSV